MRPALLIAALSLASLQAQSLEDALRGMDQAAASFRTFTARLRSVKYTAIVKDEAVEEGYIWVKRVKPGVSHLLIEFTVPDTYYARLAENKAQIYRPKIATLEEYDLSPYRDLAEQHWPFGASGRDLASRYQINWGGRETLAGEPAVKLELIPKSPRLLQHIPRLELWVSTSHWQPVQQKYYETTPGDHRLYTYSQAKVNVPVPDSRLRLTVPSRVKRIRPQR